MIEVRNVKLNVNKSGNGSLNFRMRIPNKWIAEMGIDTEKTDVKVTYEDGKIIIEKA